MISRILASPHLTSLHRQPLQRLQRKLLVHPTLDARQWPHLGMVAEWANILQPTSLWLDDSSDLPEGWVRATVIPTSASPDSPACPGVTWKLPDLHRLATHSHLALLNRHYFPTYPTTDTMNELIEGLVDAAVQFLVGRLERHHTFTCPPVLCNLRSREDTTPPSPPQEPSALIRAEINEDTHTVPSAQLSPTSASKSVSFLPLQANPGAPSLVSYVPQPRPLHHPALIAFVPEEEPPKQGRRFPRQAHSAPRLESLPPLPAPPDHDPYCTLASQQSHPDLILIGPATAPGSYYGAFAKRDTETDTQIGAYISK